MDGLDVYIDDYTQPDPIPAEMLKQLVHTRHIFDPPATEVNAEGHVVDKVVEPAPGSVAALAAAPTPVTPAAPTLSVTETRRPDRIGDAAAPRDETSRRHDAAGPPERECAPNAAAQRRPAASVGTMSAADKTLHVCSCNGTMPLDAAALARALDLAGPLPLHTELCQKELARFADRARRRRARRLHAGSDAVRRCGRRVGQDADDPLRQHSRDRWLVGRSARRDAQDRGIAGDGGVARAASRCRASRSNRRDSC